MRRFFDFLFPPRVDELAVRGVSTDDFLALMQPRLIPGTRPEAVGLLPFSAPPVRAAIHEAKYHGSERALTLLGTALTDYLRDADDVGRTTSHISIVPVPLGRQRRKERGYNQAEEVAKRMSKEFGISLDTSLLSRVRETNSQVSLPRAAREKNMRGAFVATRRADPSYTYIIIDDVITTGATLQAAVDALRTSGAQHIIPLALAY